MAKGSGKGTEAKKGKGAAKTDESSDKPAKVCPDWLDRAAICIDPARLVNQPFREDAKRFTETAGLTWAQIASSTKRSSA